MEFELDCSLKEWAKDKPLSILQLDPADRAVLRIAGECPPTLPPPPARSLSRVRCDPTVMHLSEISAFCPGAESFSAFEGLSV